ncbi:MAG: hypothetical protein QOE74_4594, partial [Mycobacterium sp.]|nr:hypothetical protein [Mycobacterium sp.]
MATDHRPRERIHRRLTPKGHVV